MNVLLVVAVLAAGASPTLTVMPFDNRTGDAVYDVMEKGFADMLLTDLAATEGLVVVERSRLNEIIGELKLQRSALFDASTVQKVGKLCGASHVVTGQLLKVAPELRVDVRLVEIATGKVLYGANVAGKPDRLFELEQELVTRFLDGLGRKGVLPTRSGPAKLETLLAYSQALAHADDGDLKTASTRLAAVMKTDSGFRLAKERYAELLKRLREAGARREQVMGAGEAELLARIDGVLAEPPGPKRKEVGVWLGYRAMRATFVLAQLSKLLGPPTVPNTKQVTLVRRSQREAARPLVRDFFERYRTLIDDVDRYHERVESTPDHQRAKELGLGDYSEVGYAGWFGRVHLADWVLQGESHRSSDVLRRLSPSPAVLEPSLVEPALKLYEEAAALAEKEKYQSLEARSDVALAHGAALLALGRKEEAMARWQQALDEMPTSPKYKELEERVELALGVHPRWKALDALKGCDRTVESAWGGAPMQLLAYDAEGLFARAAQLERWCKAGKVPYPGLPASGYINIAQAAAIFGDCPRFTRATAAARAISAETVSWLEDFGAGCTEWDK
ncbi:MAG: hypothetical protein JNK82_39705 [Myxococcaceae bacterium]|nr:hypothetical protein [Myxococcaceae bacterium]